MKRFIAICIVTTLSLGACQQQTSSHDTTVQQALGAYMIVRGKGYDREALAAYNAVLPPIYEKYGGYYIGLAPKGTFKMLEGQDPSDAIVMSAWPSVEAAKVMANLPW